MKLSLKTTSTAFALCGVLGLVVVWGVGSLLMRTTNVTVPLSVAPAQKIRFRSDSNIELVGTFWPSPAADAPAILMLHGNGSNRGSMTQMAAFLNKNGYSVLAIDFRGHGESTPAAKSFGLFEANDAKAAFDWLRKNEPGRKIGIIGFSLGGAASLLGTNGPLPADALILEGVYPDIRRAIFNRLEFRLGKPVAKIIEPLLSFQSLPRLGVWPSQISPIDALSKVREPVMLVGGENDIHTPPSEVREMFSVVKGKRELRIFAGVSHEELGQKLPAESQAILLAFLDQNLKAANDTTKN